MIGPKVEFLRSSRWARRVACSACGRNGYPSDGYGWQAACLRGHRPCPDCNKWMPITKHGKTQFHNRCPARRFPDLHDLGEMTTTAIDSV